jgi:hypothetical protein
MNKDKQIIVYYRNTKDPKDHPPEVLKQKIESGELGSTARVFIHTRIRSICKMIF